MRHGRRGRGALVCWFHSVPPLRTAGTRRGALTAVRGARWCREAGGQGASDPPALEVSGQAGGESVYGGKATPRPAVAGSCPTRGVNGLVSRPWGGSRAAAGRGAPVRSDVTARVGVRAAPERSWRFPLARSDWAASMHELRSATTC
ncbi:hypothetical protein GCM10023108_20080 [Saccharopolyspora hordei]